MGDVRVTGTGVGTFPIACAHSRWRDLGQKRRMQSSARCPGTIGGGSALPWRTRWYGPQFCASSLVLRRADLANEMQWDSMAMHYTAFLHSMGAESDGKVKCDSKRKEYKSPCPERVCNYRVKCIVCASAIRMARTRNSSFTHAN